jgi:hypothetical protein
MGWGTLLIEDFLDLPSDFGPNCKIIISVWQGFFARTLGLGSQD